MIGIILAAGHATRLYPLTKNKPKALLPVNGKCMIDYIIDEMNTLPNLEKIIVISNHKFIEAFETWAVTKSDNKIPIKILDDLTCSEQDKLGAIGDIQFCIEEEKIDDDVLIIAGDNLFTYHLKDAWDYFYQSETDVILAGRLSSGEDLTRFAIATVDAEKYVTTFEEKPKNPRSNLVVYATYFYRQETLPRIKNYLEAGGNPDAPGNFPAWLYQKKKIRLYEFKGECIDIGTAAAYEAANQRFAEMFSQANVDKN